MSDAELEELAHATSEHTAHAGEYLTRQGELGTDLYVLLDGTLEVVDERAEGQPILGLIEPVDSVGEIAALGHMPHTASLRARTDATVLVLGGDELDGWLHRHPEIAARLIIRVMIRMMGRER